MHSYDHLPPKDLKEAEATRRSGAVPLCDYPDDIVHVSCSRCARRGLIRKQRLIDTYGAGYALPLLLAKLADCQRRISMQDPCKAIFPKLQHQPSGRTQQER